MLDAITSKPLPYHDALEQRALETIDMVVIHCTELPDLATAREYGERVLYENSATGNSGHYYIDRDGTRECWVAAGLIAHHTRGYNPRSIGIELVNRGRWPNWFDSKSQTMDEAYPDVQIEALNALLEHLVLACPRLRWIAGHEDLDQETVEASNDPALRVRRKLDPGPMFLWPEVMRHTKLQRFHPDPSL